MHYTFMKHKTTPQFTATASSAEVARNFGRYKDLAQRGAVAVTSHGRESVVMLSADEYARLKALDDREALYICELPDDMVEALEKARPSEAAKAFNFELSQS
jgi:prevent-host-death family protein